MVDIVAVNLARLEAIGDDDNIYIITDMFDKNGDNTHDPKEALAIVVQTREDDWAVYTVATFNNTQRVN